MSNKKEESGHPVPELIKDVHGNTQYRFTTEDLKLWGDLGLIPPELIEGFFNNLERVTETRRKVQEFKEKFPNSTSEEMAKEVLGVPKTLTIEESAQFHKEMKQSTELHNLLLEKWPLLEKASALDILDPLFKNVNPDTEFGVVRFIADQMNHLPGLLERAEVEQTGTNEYLIKATKELEGEGVKKLIFTHPLTAQSEESAKEIAEDIKHKLLGIRHKMWQGCWLYANEIRKTQFAASINELMKYCYPTREAKFSSKEKEDFYEELRLLRQGEFTLAGTLLQQKGKRIEYKYNIPILRVGGALGEAGASGGPPDKVFIDLCAITPVPPKSEPMRFVAAPIKKRTLELNAQDCPLAFFLQVKKNQITGGEKEKERQHHDFTISQLIEAAHLQPTFISNPRMGRKRLFEKLARAKDKGIIKTFREIEDRARVWW